MTSDAGDRARFEERRAALETEKARALLAEFVATATAEGPPPAELLARSYSTGRLLRTGLRGWYLAASHAVGVTITGDYYVLSAPGGRLARRAELTPSDPPLIVGRGGRDGESVDLPVALAKALAGAYA